MSDSELPKKPRKFKQVDHLVEVALLESNTNNAKEISVKPDKKKKTPRLTWLWVLIVVLLVFSLPVICVAATGYWYLSSFSQAAGVTPKELIDSVKTGWSGSVEQTEGKTNFLILGVDEIVGQKDGSKLTDTIIIVSIDPGNSKVTLLSLPRDLWVDSLKTKINALYYYGELSNQTNGKEFASSVVSEITGVPIHYVFVVHLQDLEAIVHALNGVEITVPKTFTDSKFPRSDIDITTAETDEELYETITFEQGVQTMDGETALKYIRSRHSDDLSEGNDEARSSRQQQLIQAIIFRLKQKSFFTNPNSVGELYRIVREKIDTSEISDSELVSLARQMKPQLPSIDSISIPIQKEDTEGIIVNPPISKYKQWVYEPVDSTWQELQTYLNSQL